MNSINVYLNSLGRGVRVVVLALAVIFVSAAIAQAATTIDTSVSTANVTASGTLGVTGLSSLGYASSTMLSANTAYFGQTATSTFSSAGALTLVGALVGTTGSFSSTLAATGATALSSTLAVTGTTTLATTTVRGFTQGGGQCTITDANGGTYTLTQAELSSCNYLYITASGQGQEVIALTLPATSTMTTLLANVGDTREWLIDASDLAAATTTTITAGTGIDMIAVTNAEDVIDGAEYSELRCWRKSDTDVACITSELVDSDS